MIQDQTDVLLSHIMQNHADAAIEILERGSFNKYILTDVGCCSVPLPLYQLSICQDIMLSYDTWVDSYRPIIERNREEVSHLLNFWKVEYNYPIENGIDFSKYEEYCGHFYDWDFEELFDGSLDKLIDMGYNRDEALLCYGVLGYHSAILNEQIAKGTNPDVNISGDIQPQMASCEDGESYNALVSCDTFACDIVDCYGFGNFWENKDKVLEVRAQDIYDLLQGAAYTQLYKRLVNIKCNIKRP